MAAPFSGMFQAPTPVNAPYTPDQAYGPMTVPGTGLFGALGSAFNRVFPAVNPAYADAYKQYQDQNNAFDAMKADLAAPATPANPSGSGTPSFGGLPLAPVDNDATAPAQASPPAPAAPSGWDEMMGALGRYQGAPVNPVPAAPAPDMAFHPATPFDPNNAHSVLGMANAFHTNPAGALQNMEAMERQGITSGEAVGRRYNQLVGAGYDPFIAARQAQAEARLANPATQRDYFDSGEAAQDEQQIQQRLQQEIYHAHVTGDSSRLQMILHGMGAFSPYGLRNLTFAQDAQGNPVQYVQEGDNIRRIEGSVNGIPNTVSYFGSEQQTMPGELQNEQNIALQQNEAARKQFDAVQIQNMRDSSQIISRMLPTMLRVQNGSTPITPQNASAVMGNSARMFEVLQNMPDGPEKQYLYNMTLDNYRRAHMALQPTAGVP